MLELYEGAVLDAAVIDSALFACGGLYWFYHNDCVCIPVGIEHFRFGPGQLRAGETAHVHIALIDHGDESIPLFSRTAGFDFTIRNAVGEIVYDVKGYRATILKKTEARKK